MGSDQPADAWQHSVSISIHAPRMGSDVSSSILFSFHMYFNPRSPDGERLRWTCKRDWSSTFQSTLPGWGATVPCFLLGIFIITFQSTLPGWGATASLDTRHRSRRDFNPRSPDGERLPFAGGVLAGIDISIHAPRMGSDSAVSSTNLRSSPFQSTLPGWGATRAQAFERVLDDAISIHAPRMGSDQGRHPPSLPATHFNPRSPDGERRHHQGQQDLDDISIHAPRMGSDMARPTYPATLSTFQSTLPGWGATLRPCATSSSSMHFNPRSPDGERRSVGGGYRQQWIFQSTLPGWGATCISAPTITRFTTFQSTLPGWGATT